MGDSNTIDAGILARLRTPPLPFNVNDGWFSAAPPAADLSQPVIVPVDIAMPYVNFMSSFGDDDQPRLSGRNGQREKFFRLFHVGISREQVIGAIDMTRGRLEGHRLTLSDSPRVGIIQVDSSPLIFRDDGAVRADGKPLFSGIDNYTVRFSIRRP